MVNHAAAAPATGTLARSRCLALAIGAGREARLRDVEHGATVAVRYQQWRRVLRLDELEPLEGVTAMNMKRRNSMCAGCRHGPRICRHGYPPSSRREHRQTARDAG